MANNNPYEIRIGMVGGVDSGKSSTLSVLIHDELDDGKGKAREKVLQFKHEKESGRTSSININYLRTSDVDKYYSMVDLAGHEKYLSTTIRGLTGYYIDYVVIVVGANMGVNVMTHEHIKLAILFKIPHLVVITKIDMCPENILKETIDNVKGMIKKLNNNQSQNMPYLVKEEKDYPSELYRLCPIFLISNKEGTGINLLRKYITSLPSRYNWIDKQLDVNPVFKIFNIYQVKGIGMVLSGKVINGVIRKGATLMLGLLSNNWFEIVIKSIHNNFQTNVDTLGAGESGCIAIKAKSDIRRNQIKRGAVITSKDNSNTIREFIADIMIMNTHSITMNVGYQPMVNCGTISQSVKILEIDKEVLRGGDRGRVKLKFSYHPEYLETGQYFILRDGKTRGFGKVVSVS